MNSFAYLIDNVVASFAHILNFMQFVQPAPRTKGAAAHPPMNLTQRSGRRLPTVNQG